MANFLDLSREVRDMIYGFLLHDYHVSATIESFDPIIIYAHKLTRVRRSTVHNTKESTTALTVVSRAVRQEAFEVLFSRLIELRFDGNPRSTLSIPLKYLRYVEVVRGITTGSSGFSSLPLPSLKRVILHRPDIHISSLVLFDSFWYLKGRVQRSWTNELNHFCLLDSLIHEIRSDKNRSYDVSYHCDAVLERRWCSVAFKSTRRKLTIFDVKNGDMVLVQWSDGIKSIDRS